MIVVVTGSSGFIGGALCRGLTDGGDRVIRLVRRRPAPDGAAFWDPDAGAVDRDALEGADAVVHLAAAGLERRWSDAGKRLIVESRVRGTGLLAQTLARLDRPPAVLLSASGVGWYGDRGAEVLTEDASAGTGFLADVCAQWEAATQPAADAGVRVVRMRGGVVLHPSGGMLRRLLLPFRLGLGGRIGRGDQYVSWISRDDHVAAIRHELRSPDLRGPVNHSAPRPVTNAELARTLADVLHRPAVIPTPVAVLRMVYRGELVDELVLASQRAIPTRLESSGFSFRHAELDVALASMLHHEHRDGVGV